MRKLLFRLDGVPEDEALEIHALLDQHEVEYYETPGGKWGISVAGIWVEDRETYDRVKPLLDQYAEERQVRVREEYARLREEGRVESIWDRVRQHPVMVILYLTFAVAILYFSIMPFLHLAG